MPMNSTRAMRGHAWALAGCLVALLGLFAALLASTQLRPGELVPVAVTPLAGAADDPGGDVSRTRLRFVLPAGSADGGRWAVWMPRDPAASLQLHDSRGWSSEVLGFFAWGRDEGVLPTGYGFVLPAGLEGPVELTLEVHGPSRAVISPVLVARTADIRRMERSGVALAGAVYGGLLVLAALALALAYASRDRVFLALFGFIVVLFLLLLGLNGHLYGLPGLRVFGHWGVQGLLTLVLGYTGSWLWMVRIYAFPGAMPARFAGLLRGGAMLLVVLMLLCLLNLPVLAAPLRMLTTLAWGVGGLAGVAMLVDAVRRRMSLAWLLLSVCLLGLVSSAWIELADSRLLPDAPVLHLVYQGPAVIFALTLGMALVGRIADYRDQRDRDRLARMETERRMRWEAGRADLSTALQMRLGGLEATDIPSHGLRLMIDHLLPLVPSDACIVAAHGFHGRDHLLVEPPGILHAVGSELERRGLNLRRQATGGLALQQPVGTMAGAPGVAVEALLPLPARAPGWGVLLLRRAGGEGFSDDEMSIAGELLRVTHLHIEQAMAAIRLRRSAEMDALTGSMNRRTIDSWIERAFIEGARDGHPISVLFVDLDHFKSVNDRFGHACGDDCLRHVAQALRGALPEDGMLGRYGGEEFVVVLPGLDGAAARVIGERMRAAVENLEVRHDGLRFGLTVSIGIATRHAGERTPAETIARADKALYAAKRQGRNCVQAAPAIFS
ncbi:GGDEF domain-containing protein [Luteimonas sp. BDR2-5]|uniref:GGDEF domain-containing protein n=1 Tax=Proluteimonas luteida TaxID=2878685 RepID=UPI001E48C3D4|nr:GGDEF domain-containing protein [Luteimonas sp. BDR2-5]MCD9028925.1 GGDEF domain-containing protein [Luteimonas sp. BDR2-5]